MNESKFIKIKCPKCKSSQIVFGKASTKVKCLSCDKIIVEPSSGKAKIRARVNEIL